MDRRRDWSLVLLIFILASHIQHAPARHHHIKLRHERHRRQHGESYLPPYFVLDNEDVETGTWGSWSTPSSCSRSCGGGVAHQTRRCNDVDPDGTERCTGAKKRFFSCNIADCPEPANDFRAEQCSAYDNTPYRGIIYEWVPYTGAKNKCELNCMPRGEIFFYRPKWHVTDGTPCISGQNDVCVEGKCMPVGCDKMLGSGAKEDRCRECSGDGSACDVVQGVADATDLEVGYNDIVLIPSGATNIAITERRPSNNYLAMRNMSNHYYLNGNWRIDFPRSLKFAGTVFKYERKPEKLMAAEVITALGPTNQSIYIVLLTQEKNVGVDYKYSIPKRLAHYVDSKSYTWVAEDFSDCSSTCGGGFRSRLVRCVRRSDNEEVDDNLCDQQLEPVSNISCGEEACPPVWVIGDWGPCNKACGPGGEQTRDIKCEQTISGGIPSLVDDERCLEIVGPKDIEIQECNADIQCPQWHEGPWRPCDRLCGEGKERRKITCYKKVDGKIIVLPDSACPEERPESEKDCELGPCVGVDWVVSKWSGCDNKCGLTQETRTVSCVSLKDKIYPNEQCNPDTKPESVRKCSAQEKCNYQWYATQWSECSVECGTGIATRKVFCATSDPDLTCISKVEDEKCDPSTRYNDTQECTAEVKECKGEWLSGPWSECSKPCGGGDKTRKVICMKDNKVVPFKGNCYEDDFMLNNENCNEKACEEDGLIPEERGKPSAPTDAEEEECEDYEDDGFISVNQDLGIQPRIDDEIESSGSGLDDMMMGDDADILRTTVDNSNDTMEDYDNFELEGSGSDSSSKSTFSTDATDASESTDVPSSRETASTVTLETSTSGTSLESSLVPTSPDVSGPSNSETTESPNTVVATTKAKKLDFPAVESEQEEYDERPDPDTDTLPDPTTLSTGTEAAISTQAAVTDESSEFSTSEITTTESSSTIASDSVLIEETTEASDSTTLETSSSEMSPGSSPETSATSDEDVKTPTASDTTVSSDLDTSEPSSTSPTESYDTDTTLSPSSDQTGPDASIPDSTVSETTESSDLDTSEPSSTNATQSSDTDATESTSAETMESFGTDSTLSSSSDQTNTNATVVSSTEIAATSDTTIKTSDSSEVAVSTVSDKIETSSTDTASSGTISIASTSSESSATSDSNTIGSAGTETTKSSDSDVIASASIDTEISASTVSTVSTSSETSVASTSDITEGSSVESDMTVSAKSTEQTISTETSVTTGSSGFSTSVVTTTKAKKLDFPAVEAEQEEYDERPTPKTKTLPDTTTLSASTEETISTQASVTNEEASEFSTSVITTTESSSTIASDSVSIGETTEASDSTVVSSSITTLETSGSEMSSVSSPETFGTDASTSSSTISTVLTSSETTVLFSSDTTEFSSTETVSSSGSDLTESLSSGAPVLSSLQTTRLSDKETTESSSPDGTTPESSTSSSESITESITDGTVTERSETPKQSTGTVETSESDSTTTYSETTVPGETDITTEGDTTSDTTESGVTETEYDLDTTEQSHVTDIFTIVGHSDGSTRKHRKCRPKKPKTCKTSQFGCCYDGIKFATGPFERGCPIPKTCNETEYGCCPDGVSPAAGKNNKGCPDSHCRETLFGCCPDEVTAAEGNDYEGCEIPCNGTEFGCCLDGKTPAAGENNFGCCNTTTYGCCPNGTEPASGPDGEGCKEGEASSTITTTAEETTTEITSESCKESEFGCCPNNETSATGKYYEGCNVTNAENCTASYYKCCPDGVSAALGPDNYGCPIACLNSKFGCCIDGLTPAHGPNGEGCCLITPYGCCPDNIRNAQGPNLYGCGCQYSRYGCCPDNKTTAIGSNNEGCGCEYSPHGCCPNRLNVAHGPDFEGCPCDSHQFGCCPDGVSIAKGPHTQGCGCKYSEFDCCSDDVTPAKGPNYAGCTCDVSKYGCCPDGIEEAQGENFEGCHKVLLSRAAICTLNNDTGPCQKYTIKWFYDTFNGTCKRFWYGGCGGNENHFENQQECNDTCVEPKGRDVCLLPKIAGGCDGYHPTWYYDTDRKQCAQFIYGGCLGNANRFKTREDCEELCVAPDDADPCEQPSEPGPCEGNFTRWYFNTESSSCEEFNYGGCKGNKNNFPTEISCKQQCAIPAIRRVRDVCNLEKEPGPCPGSLLRWYYDAKHKSCRQFVYGGCKGNGNKFRTYAACEQRCPHRDFCPLPWAEGTCTEKLARWSFNQTENRCMPFYYTGCGGNRNNYETKDACDTHCPAKIEQDTCLLPAVVGECSNYTTRWYYDSYEKHCRLFYYGGCGGNDNNFETQDDCTHRCESSAVTTAPAVPAFRREYCLLPASHGPCNADSVRWYYDSRYGTCQRFNYGGCESNGNNFETVEECENRCGNVQDLCELPPLVGPCKERIRQYYYDRRTDLCYEFAFGGCQGNKNRFEDKKSCEQRCRKTTDATSPVPSPTTPRISVDPKSASCFAPLDFGPCRDNVTAFYYDAEKQTCQAFYYGGCEGNANRFQSLEQCERICGNFRGQDICNLPLDPGPCRASHERFFYDSRRRECHPFIYGGCRGNGNRFTHQYECESVCIHRKEPPAPGNRVTYDNTAICREPVDIGRDGGSGQDKRFYYDDERQDCIAFIYKGSGGNLNRFVNREACLKTCLKTNEVGPQNPCIEAQKECNEIHCPYGMVARIDEQNCERCSCADPCLPVRCQEGSKCVVTSVLREDVVVYQGVCESLPTVPKSGTCPPVVNATSCEERCYLDAQCPEDLKCCPSSCGLSCLKPATAVQPVPVEPVPREPLPTPPPVEPVPREPLPSPPAVVAVTTVPIEQSVPAFIEPPEAPKLRAEEGSYVIMKCVAIGNPRPVISWRKGVTLIDNTMGRHSVKDDGSLQIVGLYSADAGIYTCTAKNRLAAPVRIQYELEITDPRGHKSCDIFGEPNYRVTVNMDAPAYLKCYAMGWPRPIVEWWHEGKTVPVDSNGYELQRDYALKIHRVSLVNLGVYTCRAYNGIGKETSWSVTLQANGPVVNVIPEYQKYTQYIIDPTHPSPPSVFNRRPVYPVSRPHVAFYPQSQAPYILPVTEPPRVIAPATYKVPVKVNVTAEGDQFPVGSDFSILCRVNGYPTPTVQWYKDDSLIQSNKRIKIFEADRLSISYAQKNDSGRYRCEAANQYTSDSGSIDIVVSGIYIHPTCQDNLFLANCGLIVKGKFCQHPWYARFCCRSCTEAGQLPPRGPHINETSRNKRSILSIT
ncbi:papilin [Diprion similis]|uniref:papilin n=1 Tax=Diprion similis TaxID=362088 RepID=UPI001EF83931|nr:papilin [Diprion similis]